MDFKNPVALFVIAGLAVAFAAETPPVVTVQSPDGKLALRVELKDAGRATCSVTYRGKHVILDSALGMTFEGSGPFGARPKDVRMEKRTVDSTTVIRAALPSGGGQAIWLEAVK